MDARIEDRPARRELVLVATILVALARAVDTPGAWLVVGLLPIAILLAGLGALGRDEGSRFPVESLIVPIVLVAGSAAAIRLVPIGLGLVPALAAFALVLDRLVALETRLLRQATGPVDADRARVLLGAVLTAFVAFTGVAALVPGGLAGPAAGPLGPLAVAAGTSGLTGAWLLVLAADDAIVALLLGYRSSAFRYGAARDAAWSAATYAIVVAIAAGAARAIDLPQLVAPAVLTLVFYLWDALHGTAPARRREPRFLWETVLLIALGIVVVLWNLRLPAS